MIGNWWVLGRYFYSVPLFLTGLIYIFFPRESVESLTSFIPGGLSLIYVAGILWVILGLAIATGFWTRWATWGVIGLLCVFQIMVHIPAAYSGEYLAVVWFELLRDISLLGGAFFIMALAGEKNQGARSSSQQKTEANQDWAPSS